MTKAFLITFFLFSFFIASSQHTVIGVVYDAETSTPLPGANVFIANTTKGTSTNADGSFKISGLQAAPYELVISFVGYTTQVIMITGGEPVKYKILLSPAAGELKEIVVHGKGISKAKRAAYLKTFEQTFIGRSDNSKLTTLENPDLIDFDESAGTLTASADTALWLRNDGLGYRVKVLLQTYSYQSFFGALHYEGYMVFEPLHAEKEEQKKLWAKNRLKAYYGSQMHFFRSLYKRRLLEEGFSISFDSKPSKDSTIDYHLILDTVSTKQAPIVRFEGRVLVNYLNEPESVSYHRLMGVSGGKDMQRSKLIFQKPAALLKDGRTFPVDALQNTGYWSWELMAETLPLDYEPEDDLKITGQKN